MERKKLTGIQKTAARLMKEKLSGAVAKAQELEAEYRLLVAAIAEEAGITKADLGKWNFNEAEMAFIPKPENTKE